MNIFLQLYNYGKQDNQVQLITHSKNIFIKKGKRANLLNHKKQQFDIFVG